VGVRVSKKKVPGENASIFGALLPAQIKRHRRRRGGTRATGHALGGLAGVRRGGGTRACGPTTGAQRSCCQIPYLQDLQKGCLLPPAGRSCGRLWENGVFTSIPLVPSAEAQTGFGTNVTIAPPPAPSPHFPPSTPVQPTLPTPSCLHEVCSRRGTNWDKRLRHTGRIHLNAAYS